MNSEQGASRLSWINSIRGKLLTFFLLLALVPLIFVGVLALLQAQAALRDAAYARLVSLRGTKKAEIERLAREKLEDTMRMADVTQVLRQNAVTHLESLRESRRAALVRLFQVWRADVLDVSSDPDVVDGLDDLGAAFAAMGVERTRALGAALSSDEKREGDEGRYLDAYRDMGRFFATYASIHGYQDVLLIAPDGFVVYQLQRGELWAADLSSSAYGSTSLGGLYRQLQGALRGDAVIADIFSDADTEQFLYIGAPVLDRDGQSNGILVYQLPWSAVNQIMQSRDGLLSTTEPYLLGRAQDGSVGYRSDRVIKSGKIGEARSSEIADRAFAGETGWDIQLGSTGVMEIVSFAPLDITGLNWVIIITVSLEQVTAPRLEGIEQDFYTRYVQGYGYEDLLLINRDGFVYYTSQRGLDYLSNMVNGPYASSNLGYLVRQVLETGQPGMSDIAPYAPAGGRPAAFVAAPVITQGRVQVVVAARFPADVISELMRLGSDVQRGAEAYLVGSDGRMRSDSLLDPANRSVIASFAGNLEDNGVDTEATRKGMLGQSGEQVIRDYRGRQVLSAWSPVSAFGANWVLVVEQDTDQAFAQINALRNITILIVVLTAVVAVVLGIWGAATVSQPIVAVTGAATLLAAGDYTARVTVRSQDEVGVLAATFNQMAARLRDFVRSLQERTETLFRRDRYLEALSRVARDAALAQDPQVMLERAAVLIAENFGFYHVGLYTLDASREWVELRAASSIGGQRMLADKHRVAMGQGVVGAAAARSEARLMHWGESDRPDDEYRYLSETQTQMVVPLILRGEVIGVLDAHLREAGQADEQELEVLQMLADQLAVALSNVNLLRQAQSALEAERRALGQVSRQAWAQMIRTQASSGYLADLSGIRPLSGGQFEVDESVGGSVLTAPVQVRENQVGTLLLRKQPGSGEWSEQEVALLNDLLAQLDRTLDGAQLYQMVQRRQARERLTSEIVDRVRAADDVEGILRVAIDALGRELNVAEAVVRLGPESRLK